MKFKDLKIGMKVKFREDLVVGEPFSTINLKSIKELIEYVKDIQIIKSIELCHPIIKVESCIYLWDYKMIDWEVTAQLNNFNNKDNNKQVIKFIKSEQINPPLVKRVIVNYPAVIVIFNDGTKQVAKCDKDDIFDVEKGILICLSKKLLGNWEELDKVLKIGKNTVMDKLKDWKVLKRR